VQLLQILPVLDRVQKDYSTGDTVGFVPAVMAGAIATQTQLCRFFMPQHFCLFAYIQVAH
jgi:hypothetical protein